MDTVVITMYVRKQLHGERSVGRLLKYKEMRKKLKMHDIVKSPLRLNPAAKVPQILLIQMWRI